MKTIITLGLISLWNFSSYAQRIVLQQNHDQGQTVQQWQLSSSESGELALYVHNPNHNPLHVQIKNVLGETLVEQEVADQAVIAFDAYARETYRLAISGSTAVRMEIQSNEMVQ